MQRCLSLIAAAFGDPGPFHATFSSLGGAAPEPSCLVLAGVGLGLCVLALVLRSSNGRG
jgi:hypothetical protein